MDLLKEKFIEFAQYYGSDITNVFKSEKYRLDEKYYKQLLIDVLGKIFEHDNIHSGRFINQLIQLIRKELEYKDIIGKEKFEFYQSKETSSGKVFEPWDSFCLMLNNRFTVWINLCTVLENGNKDKIINLFDRLLYSDEKLESRINIFRDGFKEIYDTEFHAGHLGTATAAPNMRLNLIAIFLACVYPQKFYFYKPMAYYLTSKELKLPFERTKDAGTTYLEAIRFADDIKRRLNDEAGGIEVDNIDTQSFIYVLARIKTSQLEGGDKGKLLKPVELIKSVVKKESCSPLPTESQIENYILENWEAIPVFQDYYIEEGNSDYGGQYPVSVGSIDILAHHKTKKEWLVIELKKDQGGHRAVGEILKYIPAVRKEIAEPDDEIRGLIIVGAEDKALRYAMAEQHNINLAIYSIQVEMRDKEL